MSQENITFSKIAEWFIQKGGMVKNFGLSEDHVLSYPRAIDLSEEHNISMLTLKYKDTFEKVLAATKCKLIIMPAQFLSSETNNRGRAFLLHENPKELLIDYCKAFLHFERPPTTDHIHPSAVIEEGAILGTNNHIGANVFISKNSILGNHCIIGANSVIKNAVIGDSVKIGSNNTIGENGFGYSKLDSGNIELFPHYGQVLIEDHVHIGNNNCIDRGSLSDTIIMRGVKIDNLVHIAHNVSIGKNSMIIACSMIAGSVVIGENSWVAPSSSIRNNMKIGKDSTVGIGSVVTKNVDENQTVLGNPAMPIDNFLIIRKEQKELISKNKNEPK